MAITRATGFPTSSQTTSATAPAVTWVTVGDLGLLAIANFGSGTIKISTVSSTKATGWTQVVTGLDGSEGWTVSLWVGTITSTGADSITVTWSGTTPTSYEVMFDEFNSGLGSSNVWAVVTGGSLRTTASPWNYPSLTSNTVTLQTYWGYQATLSGNPTGGTGTGFTFTTTAGANQIAWNGSLATSTAFQPAMTGGAAADFAVAGIMSVSLPPSASPKPIVVTKSAHRKGVLFFRKTPPVFTAPNQYPQVHTFVRRNRGQVHLLTFPPVQPSTIPKPIVKTQTRRNKGFVHLSTFPPVFTAPNQYPIVKTFVRRNKGQQHLLSLPPPPIVHTYPPLVKTFTRRNRGQTHLLTFPPLFTAPNQYPIVKTFTRRNKGVTHLLAFPPPLVTPNQFPQVHTFTRRNKGQIKLLTFPPVRGVPGPPPIVHTFVRRNKGQVHYLVFPPVFKAPTQKPQVHTFIRRNAGVIWDRRPPPISTTPIQPPGQFSGCGPYTYWKVNHLPNWQTFVELATCIALNVTLLGEGASGWPLSILRDSTNHPVKTLSNGAIEDRGLKLLASVALRAPIV